MWSGDLSQAPIKGTSDRTARTCHTRMRGAACCCCWAAGLSFCSQLGVSMPSACICCWCELLPVGSGLSCSRMIRSRTNSISGREVDHVVWSRDRSQDPIKATRHSTARTCETRMVLPAADSGQQDCSFRSQQGASMLSACCCCYFFGLL